MMSNISQAYETQMKNIQKKTGMTLEELTALIHQSGLQKHAEIRQMMQERLGLGYGDANTLVHFVRNTDGERAAQVQQLSPDAVLDGIYTGSKAHLRPLHEKVMAELHNFGEFEIAPKKGYVSLRLKKQFAMLGPGSKQRLEVGINHKQLSGSARLKVQPAGGMCQYKVFLTNLEEVDAELLGWLRAAFEAAG
ncbi:MAG: DUF4287 domain-containing protein [Chloroflexi bacterium HGW-Chloroflexi-10]|nr:MAG: DUF4287 domain-containing protein [Chloroflexi bacterium HGW-Chloroflexi-10]